METNLFLQALGTEKTDEIKAISNNKAFGLRIIKDLDKVFETNYSVKDDTNSCAINTKQTKTRSYGTCNFIVDKDGIHFTFKGLAYYKVESYNSHIKAVGELYEKYMRESRGNKDEDWITERGSGEITIKFSFVENDIKLSDKLKDIIYFMEKERYSKRF
jgi:hypothetical protein